MNLNPDPKQQPWWNRPILGKVSLLERLLSNFNRKPVPELALSLHDTELENLTKIAPTLQMLDNESFSPEFLLYISLKQQVENNQGDYKGLAMFIKILRFAIEKNSHFQTVKKIELDYQGKTQKELYDFVFEQLTSNPDKDLFKEALHNKIEQVISLTRNELVRNALYSYQEALNGIADAEIGLNLLLLFKKYNIANYEVFNVIHDILKQLKKQELDNLKVLVLVVKANYEQLENLGKLIGIPGRNNEPITYAKIFQYIALCYKYDNLNFRFQQLQDNLLQWEKHYRTLKEVREEYPEHEYKLSEQMTQLIPGEFIYNKYKDYIYRGSH